ncbi:MAG: hypothetical protein U0802_14760 [Candidatus Binatia bacterium]
MKVYGVPAVVSEAGGHGMQVLDLRQLRSPASPPVTFAETAWYGGFGNAHTIAVNTDTGFVYAAGTNTCGGGLHMIDVRSPSAPRFAGCVASDGYTRPSASPTMAPTPPTPGASCASAPTPTP